MSLPKNFSIPAADGKRVDIPSVGFGTWASGDTAWCKESVLIALKAGYRHLDCAWMYGVDQAIGEAIRESGIPRSEIFVVTKFWPHFSAPENVELCLDICLKQLGLDYVDMYLAHWPYAAVPISREALLSSKPGPGTSPEERGQLVKDGKVVIDWEHTSSNIARLSGKQGSYVPTWNAMKELVKNGKTRTIGVSNFTITDLKDILPHAKDVPISCNQIEVHPWLPQNELVAFGKENDILITCYCPFAGQKAGKSLLGDERIVKLAEKNKMDVGQLLQSWAVGRGTAPLGKSSTPKRIQSNIQIRKLSEEDAKVIDAMALPGTQGRTCDFSEELKIHLFKE